jgi:hypothetical protein
MTTFVVCGPSTMRSRTPESPPSWADDGSEASAPTSVHATVHLVRIGVLFDDACPR